MAERVSYVSCDPMILKSKDPRNQQHQKSHTSLAVDMSVERT